MRDHEPTVRSRELGLALSRAATARGLNASEVARLMGWSASKMSRLYSGKRGACTEDVSAILAICGIIGPKRDELLDMARQANERGWWQDFGDRLPPELSTLTSLENDALVHTSFENAVVPGLLQTPAYMRKLMYATPSISAKEIPNRIDHRLQRQQILEHRYPARFYLDEYALSRQGPGREIMSEQLHHLLRMAVRSYVEIRIIPDRVGFHAGQRPFKAMQFQNFHSVVFLDSHTSALFLERPDTTATYSRVAAYLDNVGLDRQLSREWLATRTEELSAQAEEHDDLGSPPEEQLAQ